MCFAIIYFFQFIYLKVSPQGTTTLKNILQHTVTVKNISDYLNIIYFIFQIPSYLRHFTWSLSTLLDPQYKSIFLDSDQLSDIKYDFLDKLQSLFGGSESHDESHSQDLNETNISSSNVYPKTYFAKAGQRCTEFCLST
jgi:hypothetical protein